MDQVLNLKARRRSPRPSAPDQLSTFQVKGMTHVGRWRGPSRLRWLDLHSAPLRSRGSASAGLTIRRGRYYIDRAVQTTQGGRPDGDQGTGEALIHKVEQLARAIEGPLDADVFR